MLFNSFEFIVFLPSVFCLYWFVFNKSALWQNVLLLAASCVFYGWFSCVFLGLLGISIALNYVLGLSVGLIERKKARVVLWFGVLTNIGVLYLFKYNHFFDVDFNSKLQNFALQPGSIAFAVIVPVGLSFYTLRAISYIFDVYKGKTKPIPNFIDYSVFQSFFPLLLAGPIERTVSLAPQIKNTRTFDYAQAVEGGRRIIWGMFKKMVIANNLALIVDRIFNSYQGHSATTLIIGAIAFSFQLYADVSGYADIAIGTAKLLGFNLTENFRFPYFSRNLVEFWSRWHITLTSWFKDYIYLPIRGSKAGVFRTVVGILIGFVTMAVWHFAGWNFVVWGLIHAIGLLFVLALGGDKVLTKDIVAQNRTLPTLTELAQMLATFAFMTMAWVFFRLEDVSEGYYFISRIVTNSIQYPEQYLKAPSGSMAIVYIIPLLLIDWWMRSNDKAIRVPKNKMLRMVIYYLLIVMAYFMLEHNNFSFMYFKF